MRVCVAGRFVDKLQAVRKQALRTYATMIQCNPYGNTFKAGFRTRICASSCVRDMHFRACTQAHAHPHTHTHTHMRIASKT